MNICVYACNPWYRVNCEWDDGTNRSDNSVGWSASRPYNNSYTIDSVLFSNHMSRFIVDSRRRKVGLYNEEDNTSEYCYSPSSDWWCEKCESWYYSNWYMLKCEKCGANTYSKSWAGSCTNCPSGTESGEWYGGCYGCKVTVSQNLGSSGWQVNIACSNPWGAPAEISLYCGIEWEDPANHSNTKQINRLCNYPSNSDTSPKEYTPYCIVKDPMSGKTYRDDKTVIVAWYVEPKDDEGSPSGWWSWWGTSYRNPCPDFCPNWDHSWSDSDKRCCVDPWVDPAEMNTSPDDEVLSCGDYTTITWCEFRNRFNWVTITGNNVTACWVHAYDTACQNTRYSCYQNSYHPNYFSQITSRTTVASSGDDGDWWDFEYSNLGTDRPNLDQVDIISSSISLQRCWPIARWNAEWDDWRYDTNDPNNDYQLSLDCCCTLGSDSLWKTCMAVRY